MQKLLVSIMLNISRTINYSWYLFGSWISPTPTPTFFFFQTGSLCVVLAVLAIFFSFIKGEEAAVFCGLLLLSLLCTYVSLDLGKYWESMCSPPSWNELCGKALPSSSEPTSLPPHLSVTCWGERESQVYLWRIVQGAVQITVLKPKSAIAGCTSMLSLYSTGYDF